uniref:Type III effector n=1 Tax=Heterorhabditis bacteriophora TaxID=37862 RepID=A0A1I7WFU0_HETBA
MSTISERLDAIIKQSAWNQQPNSSLSEINATDISLSDRLTALNKSVDNWQNHVKKEDLPTFNSSGGNNRASLCLLEKSDEKIYRTKNCLPSNTDILLNLEKGLKSFFFNSVPYFSLNGFEQNDFDVDVIAQTDM